MSKRTIKAINLKTGKEYWHTAEEVEQMKGHQHTKGKFRYVYPESPKVSAPAAVTTTKKDQDQDKK